MTLKQTRLITSNVAELTHLYESVTSTSASVLDRSYVQFLNDPCKGLAIADQELTQAYGEASP